MTKEREYLPKLESLKGRVVPVVAALKVIEVIDSCLTPEQVKGAERLVENFYNLYGDWLFDETEEEITSAMEDKKNELKIPI